MSDTPKRGWFSFSLRDMMWFTVLIALAVAWFVEQRRAADLTVERRRLADELSKEREWKSNLREIQGSVEGAYQFKRVYGESPNSNTLRQNLSRPFLPTSSAPAPNPPKPLRSLP